MDRDTWDQTDDYLEELFNQRHHWEMERRDKLNQSLAYPTGIVFAVGGLVSYIGRLIPSLGPELWRYLLIALVGLMAMGCVFVVAYLVRAYHNHQYGYMPDSAAILEHSKNLKTHCETYYTTDADRIAHTATRRYILNKLIECGKANTKNNNQKSVYLHKANSWLVFTLVVVFMSLIPCYLAELTVDKTQKVEIVNIAKGGQSHDYGRYRSVVKHEFRTRLATQSAIGNTAATRRTRSRLAEGVFCEATEQERGLVAASGHSDKN